MLEAPCATAASDMPSPFPSLSAHPMRACLLGPRRCTHAVLLAHLLGEVCAHQLPPGGAVAGEVRLALLAARGRDGRVELHGESAVVGRGGEGVGEGAARCAVEECGGRRVRNAGTAAAGASLAAHRAQVKGGGVGAGRRGQQAEQSRWLRGCRPRVGRRARSVRHVVPAAAHRGRMEPAQAVQRGASREGGDARAKRGEGDKKDALEGGPRSACIGVAWR